MRYALAVGLAVVLMPAVAQAGSNWGFFFGFGGFGGGYYQPYYPAYGFYGYYRPVYYPPVYYPAYSCYPSYGYGGYYGGGYYRKGYYGGGYYGRYSAAKPYYSGRYANTQRSYNYINSRAYDGDRYGYNARGPYYGPAVERYQRDARNYPSYHYDRREAYNSPGRAGNMRSSGDARASRSR
jgi:hypothetical protein